MCKIHNMIHRALSFGGTLLLLLMWAGMATLVPAVSQTLPPARADTVRAAKVLSWAVEGEAASTEPSCPSCGSISAGSKSREPSPIS